MDSDLAQIQVRLFHTGFALRFDVFLFLFVLFFFAMLPGLICAVLLVVIRSPVLH